MHTRYSKYFFDIREHAYVPTIPMHDYIPVDIEFEPQHITVRQRVIATSIPGAIPQSGQIYDQEWIRQEIDKYDNETKQQLLYTFHEKIYICSDGGLKHNNGSYGVAIGNTDRIIGSFGNGLNIIYNDLSSYRTEGAGMLQAIKFIIYVIKERVQQQRWNYIPIHFFCDNKSIVDMVNKMKYRKPTLKQYYSTDSDILIGIRKQISELQGLVPTIYITHVK
jgi:hypothetical protein